MTEYYPIRLALAGLSLVLAARLFWRRIPWHLFWFSAILALIVIYDAVPQILRPMAEAPGYWRRFVLPYEAANLIFQITVSLSLFRFMKQQTYPSERRFLVLFSVGAGLMLAWTTRSWQPETSLQALQIGRQYVLLILATAVTCAWISVRHLHPLWICGETQIFGPLWCLWLWDSFLMSTTVKGGLLWTLTPWETGGWWWRFISEAGMIGEAVLICILMRRIEDISIAEPPVLRNVIARAA